MPKPNSKTTLLQALDENQKQQSFPQGTLNRNIRDVLGHLHYWHLMIICWYTEGMQGIKSDMSAKGYTWKITSQFNVKIWDSCQSISLPTTLETLQTSFEQLQQIIQSHTDEELFEKKRYFWTGSTSLGAYLISNTSSHYHWALQQIKKGIQYI